MLNIDPTRQKLLHYVSIQLTCQSMPYIRAFGGTGSSRRRETQVAITIAERLATKLRYSFFFQSHGGVVIKSIVASVIESALLSVADDVARNWSSKDSGKRDAAKELIALTVTDALLSEFAVLEKRQPRYAGEFGWGD